MPLFKITTFWVMALNIIGWPVIHLLLAWIFLRLPSHLFQNRGVPTFRFEVALYERLLFIKRWKHLLPDGAAWFRGGFPKQQLRRRDAAYRERFMRECTRSEVAHWAMLAAGPIFWLWNPPWALCVMLVYGVVANVPCIVTQRYNRIRLSAIAAARPIPPT